MLWRRMRRLWWLLLVGFAAETQFCVYARNPLLKPLLGAADPQNWLHNLQTIGTAALGATAAVTAVRAVGRRGSNGVHRSLRPVDASALSRLTERAASFPSKPHSPTHEIVRKDDARATIECGVPIFADTIQRLLKGMRCNTESVRVMEANNDTLVVSEKATFGWRTQVFRMKSRVCGDRLELTITGPAIGRKGNSSYGMKMALHVGDDDDDHATAVCVEASSSEAFQHTAETIVEALISHLKSQLSAYAARQRIAGQAREALQQERFKRQQAKVDKVLHPEKYRTKRTRSSSSSGRSSASSGQRSTRWDSSRMQSMKRG